MRFELSSSAGVSGYAHIGEITFKAIGQNGIKSPIQLNAPHYVDDQGNKSNVTLIGGDMVISKVRHGDVNCDGSRTAVDALFTLQYDVGMRGGSTTCTQSERGGGILYMPNCDVNDDGQCNSIDALFSLQCDIGMINASCPDGAVQQTLWSRGYNDCYIICTEPIGWTYLLAIGQ